MFTTVAYSDLLALTAAFQQLPAIPDQHIKTQGASVFVSSFNRLLGAMACIPLLPLLARLTSPTIRRLAPVQIMPINVLAFASPNQAYDIDINRNIVLDIDEQLEVEFAGTAGAASQTTIAVWLADAEIKPVIGQIFTVRATCIITSVIEVWAYSPLLFADDLPVGNYDVVGMDVIAATGIVARLVPVGGINRPGVPCRQAVGDIDPKGLFRGGKMGVFCTFPHSTIPGIEVLSSAVIAGVTIDVFLDLIKK